MTRRNSIQTIHEPFGDAFYYGPERLGTRFENDEEARQKSGFAESTFKTIMDRIEREAAEVFFSRAHFWPFATPHSSLQPLSAGLVLRHIDLLTMPFFRIFVQGRIFRHVTVMTR